MEDACVSVRYSTKLLQGTFVIHSRSRIFFNERRSPQYEIPSK